MISQTALLRALARAIHSHSNKHMIFEDHFALNFIGLKDFRYARNIAKKILPESIKSNTFLPSFSPATALPKTLSKSLNSTFTKHKLLKSNVSKKFPPKVIPKLISAGYDPSLVSVLAAKAGFNRFQDLSSRDIDKAFLKGDSDITALDGVHLVYIEKEA